MMYASMQVSTSDQTLENQHYVLSTFADQRALCARVWGMPRQRSFRFQYYSRPYTCVAKREQARGAINLSTQLPQHEHYCRQAGLILDPRFCQGVGVSGHTTLSRRPGGAHLLRRLAWQQRTGGPIRHVVVTQLARLFGHAQEALAYLPCVGR